jgi:hypothetical protein
MFTIEMLPAAYGDALWIEYGDARRPHRVLIDTGVVATYDTLRARILALPARQRRFDLLIVSHVDSDHIEGVLPLLQDDALGVTFDDVWFNGWKHISDMLGPTQGEYLSALLTSQRRRWNHAFGGGTVVVPDDGPLPVKTLPGGMTLTLLSPTPTQLARLAPEWERVVVAAGLRPGDVAGALADLAEQPRFQPDALGRRPDVARLAETEFRSDAAKANGSSIAVLAEFDGKSVLLAADAFAPVMEASLRRLLAARSRPRLPETVVKLSHHGSTGNTSRTLLALLECHRFLVSTNGAKFNHPDAEAIARCVVGRQPGTELHFNYRSAETTPWSDRQLERDWKYRAFYPASATGGLAVTL